MQIITRYLIFFMAVVCALYALCSLRVEFAWSYFNSDKREFSDLLAIEKQRRSEEYKEATQMLGSDYRFFVEYSDTLYLLGQEETKLEKKAEYFCQALEALNQAIKKRPFSSWYLIKWANIKQMMGSYPCNLVGANVSYVSVVEKAIENDPTNTQVLFAAARIFILAGEKERAYNLLNQFLELEINPKSIHKEYIQSLILDDESLEAIVPARMPQIIRWAKRLKNAPNNKWQHLKERLAKMQMEALQRGVAEYEKGQLPEKVYFKQLSALFDVAANSAFRKALDTKLAEYFSKYGREKLANYFNKRKTYRSLGVVKGFIASDTRPRKGPLFNWGNEKPLYLDSFYTSVGFFLPDRQSVHIIQLKSVEGGMGRSLQKLELMVSDDNQNWHGINDRVESDTFELNDAKYLVFYVPGKKYRYWKIHYSSSSKDKRFVDKLHNMISVFGL